MKKRIVLHADIDCFFAQVEERENPQFKGFPVIVGSDPKKGRGVVSTCNYKAREYGIKSGMPTSEAYRLCPDAVFLPVNSDLYKRASVSFFKIIKDVSEEMEKVSVDEAYLDLTDKVRHFKEAEEVGRKLKEYIFKKESLTCTIGIGENKMMSKLACKQAKPNGIKVIRPSRSSIHISDLPIESIPGIGPRTKEIFESILNKKNLKVKDARGISKEELISTLGKRGKQFYRRFQGIDDSPIENKKRIKSIGKEHTFNKDTRDPEKIISTFKKLTERVAGLTKGKKIKGLVVICRFADFKTQTRQISFTPKVCKREFLYKRGVRILLRFLTENGKKIRLLGLRVKIAEDKGL